MWIKLTRATEDSFIYLNMDNMKHFYRTAWDGQEVTKVHDAVGRHLVKETPEQILELIRMEKEKS